MNELHRVHVGTAWLPDMKPRFGDDQPRIFEFEWDLIEQDALIRTFNGSIVLRQHPRSAYVEVDIAMSPNPLDRWHHEPIDENVDLEMDMLSGHGVQRWTMRHGIGNLTCEDVPRSVWHATHVATQLFASEISHMELYIWREEFRRCHG